MDVQRFFETLGPRYYAWGTVFAYPRTAERHCRILDRVQGMTTPSVMQLLSTAVECLDPGECYLEAGTWRGATFIGALAGNPGVHGYAIDDDTMDEHDHDDRASADVWREHVDHFGLADRAHYITGSTPEVWTRPGLTDGRPVGVYLFDGDKSTPEAALDGLMGGGAVSGRHRADRDRRREYETDSYRSDEFHSQVSAALAHFDGLADAGELLGGVLEWPARSRLVTRGVVQCRFGCYGVRMRPTLPVDIR